jgi:site-specific DNA recombinase
MSKNSKHKEKVSGKFLLNGILRCPQCGSGMVGSNRYQYHNNVRKTVAYYICGAHHNKGRSACGANTIQSEKVENMVLKQISKYIKQPGLEKILYDYIVQNISDTSKFPARLKVLSSDLSILEAKIARVKEMFVEGFITNIELKSKLNEHLEAQEKINSEIDSIKTQLQSEATPELDITMEDIREILDRLYEIFTKTDDRLLLKRFLNSIVDSIEVKDRLKADMKVKINFSDGIIRMFEKQLPAYLAFKYQREI